MAPILLPCHVFVCLAILNHMTSKILVQVVEIVLEKDNCLQFLYQRYSSFFKSRASIATSHLSGEYPVYSGVSVSRASSSVMVSLNDPAFHVPECNMSHPQDVRSVAPFHKDFHSSGVILYKGSCSVALRFCRNCLSSVLVYSSTSSGVHRCLPKSFILLGLSLPIPHPLEDLLP
jgi:hypothetical protein